MSGPPTEAPDLSVVVLAYNEEANLRIAVEEILGVLRALPRSWELIIVDDGSSDGTGRVADVLATEEPRVRVVHHGTNRGLGGGYRTGFAEARGERLTFFPADGQFPATIITQFLGEMGTELDMVLGYLPNRTHEFLARSLSAAERILYFALFGRMPRFQGIVMFRRKLLDELPLISTGPGWGIIMELIVRTARGPYRTKSVPTDYRPRMSGESKAVSAKNVRANLEQVLAIRRAIRSR